MSQSPAPHYPQALGGPAFVPARRGGLKWVAALLAALVAALCGLSTLWLIGYGTGLVPFLTGLVVAALPVPVYVTLVLWLDRYEPEPSWLLATAFFWGALVAVFFAIIINSFGVAVVQEVYNEDAANFYGLVISAPLVEESAKAFAIFVLFFWKRDEFDGVLDGIVYAAMVGLGFAMTENVKYYGEAVAGGKAVGVFVVRGLFSPFAHPLFTSMTGIGLGLARQSRSRVAKAALPFVGFALAVVLHAGWNGSAYFAEKLESGLLVLGMYFLVMVPTFVALLVVVFLALRREGRILREHLRSDLERGLLTHEEYQRVCSVRSRARASLDALTRGGPRAWRARVQFNRAASELAFHRNRVARGIKARDGSDAHREASYVRQIYELRLRLASNKA
ncbi:MAG: PrsW family intramembrane metalloprotease [Acidobacteria bacterium]|nr:PrsW family intramembrane metalloprotease [Acidobacteriota bacterium]